MTGETRITKVEILSDNRYTLKKVTFERQDKKGDWTARENEVYERGNAATILLYNVEKGTVILTRQFRLPTYLNGNPTGMLVETCAGLLDDDSPEDCVSRESIEETGYKVENLTKIFEVYMSAGGLTELVYFFTGTYSEDDRINEGGGLPDEQEDIEVMELPFEQAYSMIQSGEIKDAKTIMLLQYAHIHQLVTA